MASFFLIAAKVNTLRSPETDVRQDNKFITGLMKHGRHAYSITFPSTTILAEDLILYKGSAALMVTCCR